MEHTSRLRPHRQLGGSTPPAVSRPPTGATPPRHRPGAFTDPPKTRGNSWLSQSLQGSYDCACGCRTEMTTAAIVLHEVTADGTLGRRIGPCNPRCAPRAVAQHRHRPIAIVHVQFGKAGANANDAAAQSNALLFQSNDGPFANVTSGG